MPSTNRTTSSTNIDGQISINTSILRGKIDSRLRIDPDDLDLIRDSYNLFLNHSHQMYDLSYSAFPNTPPRGSSSRTVTSNIVNGGVTAGTVVEFDDDNHTTMSDTIFDLIGKFNSYVHTHFHQWWDEHF